MRKKCMKVASNDNNHQIEERKSRSPPQVLNLFLFVGYLIRKKNYSHFFNDKAYSRGFISSHCHSYMNKPPLPRVCYPKEMCLIFFWTRLTSHHHHRWSHEIAHFCGTKGTIYWWTKVEIGFGPVLTSTHPGQSKLLSLCSLRLLFKGTTSSLSSSNKGGGGGRGRRGDCWLCEATTTYIELLAHSGQNEFQRRQVSLLNNAPNLVVGCIIQKRSCNNHEIKISNLSFLENFMIVL